MTHLKFSDKKKRASTLLDKASLGTGRILAKAGVAAHSCTKNRNAPPSNPLFSCPGAEVEQERSRVINQSWDSHPAGTGHVVHYIFIFTHFKRL